MALRKPKALPSKQAKLFGLTKTFDMKRSDCVLQIAHWLRRYMDQQEKIDGWREWTFAAIAARAGVLPQTVSRLYNAEVRHPWTDKLMAILSDGCMLEVSLIVKPRRSRGVLKILS